VQDYLGSRIIKDPKTKTIMMTQPGLIKLVLYDLNLLHDSKVKDTPSIGILYPRQRWDTQARYLELPICKLNYTTQNTRPDISCMVHQCACYSTNPTNLHELAIKHIRRYLLDTKDKGLILKSSIPPRHVH
jgi:hypothetical protein